jgi:hypothetical protein
MDVFRSSFQNPAPLPVEQLDTGSYQSALADARGFIDTAPIDAVIHGIGVRLHTNNPIGERFGRPIGSRPSNGPHSPRDPHLFAAPVTIVETSGVACTSTYHPVQLFSVNRSAQTQSQNHRASISQLLAVDGVLHMKFICALYIPTANRKTK